MSGKKVLKKVFVDSCEKRIVIDEKKGTIATYKGTKLHSFNDEPSLVNKDYKMWHNEGVVHRGGNKPAVEFTNGAKAHYDHGVLHNEIGAAVKDEVGRSLYFLYGKSVTKKDILDLQAKKSINSRHKYG